MQRTTKVLGVIALSFLFLIGGYWFLFTGDTVGRNKEDTVSLPSTFTPSGQSQASSGLASAPPPSAPHPFTHPAKREDLWVDVSQNEDTLVSNNNN